MELQDAFDAGFQAVKEYVDDELGQFKKRIAALEAKTAEFKYLGTFDAERQYRAGNFVTFGGSVWHCNSDTKARPGDSADLDIGRQKRPGREMSALSAWIEECVADYREMLTRAHTPADDVEHELRNYRESLLREYAEEILAAKFMASVEKYFPRRPPKGSV